MAHRFIIINISIFTIEAYRPSFPLFLNDIKVLNTTKTTVAKKLVTALAEDLPVWIHKNCKTATISYLKSLENIGQSESLAADLNSLLHSLQASCQYFADMCSHYLSWSQNLDLQYGCDKYFPIFSDYHPNHSGQRVLYNNAVVSLNNSATCPSVLVVPEHPDDPDVQWVGPSGCAVGCKSPIWSTQEYEIFEKSQIIAGVVGIIPSILMTVTWTIIKERRSQYLIKHLMWQSFMLSNMYFAMALFPFEYKFCKDNAVTISSKDGFHLCTFDAIVCQYLGFSCILNWFCQAIDLYVHIVLHWNNSKRLWPLYIGLIYFGSLLPLIPIFVKAARGDDSFGYYRGLLQCWIKSPLDMWTFIFPAIGIAVVGTGLVFAVVKHIFRRLCSPCLLSPTRMLCYKCRPSRVHTTWFHSTEQTRTTQTVSTINVSTTVGARTKHITRRVAEIWISPFAFLVCFSICCTPWWIWRLSAYIHGGSFPSGNTDAWFECILRNFHHGDDTLWQRVCGSTPPDRSNPIFVGVASICLCLVSVLLSLMYVFSPSLWRDWKYNGTLVVRAIYTLVGYKRTGGAVEQLSFINGMGKTAL